jgi:hypothetical protein
VSGTEVYNIIKIKKSEDNYINKLINIQWHMRFSHAPVVLGRARDLPSPSKGLKEEVRISAVVAGAGLQRRATHVRLTSCICYETDRSKIFTIEWPLYLIHEMV